MSIYNDNIFINTTGVLTESRIQAITEAYIGKTPTLLEAEKQMGLIRSAIAKNKDNDKLPEVLAFNRLMEKQFGMDCFVLCVDKRDIVNGWTDTIGTKFDIALKTNASKLISGNLSEGFKYKPGNNLCIRVTLCWGILGNEKITDAEIIACILHEVGHNISCCIYNKLRIRNENIAQSYLYYLIAMSMYIITIPACLRKYRDNVNKIVNRKGKKTKQHKLKGLFTGWKAKHYDNFALKLEIKRRLNGEKEAKRVEAYKNSERGKYDKQNALTSLERQDEIIADKMAGIYGYGPEQASLLLKFETMPTKAEVIVKSMGDNAVAANSAYNNAYLDINDYDCHPHAIQRLNEELRTLKNELSRKGHDPKYEAIIKSQIKELEDILKKALDLQKAADEDERTRVNYFNLLNEKNPNATTEDLEDVLELLINDKIGGGEQ